MRALLLLGLLIACEAPDAVDLALPDAGGLDGRLARDAASDSAAPDATPPDAAPPDAAPATPPPTPFTDNLHLGDRVLAIAHRGGRRFAPEETLPAFAHAASLGVDVLELDLQATADGVVVCMHDSNVDRTTDGAGRLGDFTFEELRALDAGYHFSPDGGETFPYRGQGVVVPTLEEVLEAFPDLHYAIEIKQGNPPIVDEVVEILRATGADARVAVAAFADAVVWQVREADPDLVTALGLTEIIAFTQLTDDTEAGYTPPGHLLQIPPRQGSYEVLTPELVARAHRLGMRVQVWTLNDRAEMEAALQMGVDGVMTDDPELLLEVLSR